MDEEKRIEEKILFWPEDFREDLEALFTYIPYFEERVNGTFKFRYYDSPKEREIDPEAYDRSQKAKYPDPMTDETYLVFREIVLKKIACKVKRSSWTPNKELGELSPKELFTNILFSLVYDTVHERMCTGHTAYCMESGSFLRELKLLQYFLNHMNSPELKNASEPDWQSMSPDDRKHTLFKRQKDWLDTFLSHGAIDRSQYEKSLAYMIEEMGMSADEKKDKDHD